MRTTLYGPTIAAFAVSAALAASSAFAYPPPVVPEEGKKYPLGTTVTGACEPEPPLPSAPSATYREERRSHLRAELSTRTEEPEVIGRIYPTDDPGRYGSYDGPCTAEHYADGNGSAFSAQEYGGIFQPRVPGRFQIRIEDWTTTYFSDAENDSTGWFEFPSDPERSTFLVRNFEMYNACAYVVTGVEGRVLKGRPGSRPQTVREGDVLAEGDTVTIAAKGRARVSGFAGNNLGMGPGEYQLADSEACERIFQALAPVADGPLPVKVKEGEVTQTIGEEIDAILEAGKNLFTEGVFSNLRRGSATGGVTKYTVNRSARRKRTETCARRGQIRVYTTDPDVPPGKRELVLSAGECAMTKDGRAPRRVKGD